MINGEELVILRTMFRSRECSQNRRLNMPTSFLCVFCVRAHVKNLAYKPNVAAIMLLACEETRTEKAGCSLQAQFCRLQAIERSNKLV